MLLKKILLIIIFLLTTLFEVNAQLVSNIWYFGNHAGITFGTNPPTALTNGQMSTYEGCATISDSIGQLLFYTEGATVWNKNHQIMDNGTGLNGTAAAAQSSIILPKPGDHTRYYIFTIDAEENNFGANGLQYSEVDISMNGGLGKVITKNIELIKPTQEKVTVAQHINNIDYWIITHGTGNNNYYSFLVTSAGINTIPVISSVGSYQNDSTNLVGYLKASNDSKKLASAHYHDSNLELFDFDNSNGTVFNAIQIGNNDKFYGVEFSPDNHKLYASVYNTSSVYQYDLLSANIANSKSIIYNDHSCCGGALQIGLDKKIYFSKYGNDSLSVINNPDNTVCNFVKNAIYLNGKICQFGLPNIVTSLIIKHPVYPVASFLTSATNICQGEQITFTNSTLPPVTSFKWLVNGQEFATSKDTNYIFDNTGIYTITLVAVNDTCSDTADLVIKVNPIKHTILNPFICQGESFQTGTHVYTSTGNYIDTLTTISGCDSIITTHLTTQPIPIVNLGNDTIICEGENILLNATTANATYLWQDGSVNPIYQITKQGIQWVKVTIHNCYSMDSIYIIFDENCNTIYVPNAFVPRGFNKIFKPSGNFLSNTEYYFAIYNRWGLLLFETRDYENGWDGTYNDKLVEAGIYVYYLKIKYGGQLKSFEKTGIVNFIE